MIEITINGECTQVASSQSVSQILQSLDELPQAFAIAVNAVFVPKGAYQQTIIEPGDSIELLVPMQGG